MTVLIKGMKMPETKYDCPFWNKDYICLANEEGIVCDTRESVCLPDNCPLVEVPEPHGRLIDTTTAYQDTMQYGEHFRKSVLRVINDLPTVIESEGNDYDYKRASDMRDYCERYEPTYNPEDGSV